MARVGLLIMAFLLGHDALMAMGPHDHDADATHHVIAVEQCGIDDGRMQNSNPLPSVPDMVADQAVRWTLWPTDTANAPVAPVLDASIQRAFLQVFLN